MNKTNKLKIFNDPIYGFIAIPDELIYDLIQHRYFQRLRRITQMGLSYLVYPGAHHTRFHHVLGAMHLMQRAVETLRQKKVVISDKEEQALYIAILLHDIGHGPFSHAMEHSIVDVHHEEISIKFMDKLNEEFSGALSLAIAIFKGNYPREFMHQLISSQLDMDRLDYLKRDSFYSGVVEGNINSERLIQMLNVSNDRLVIDEKGIYSIENFLVGRRLMYWQVYLHKTSIAAESMLVRVLTRAKLLVQQNKELKMSESIHFFLENKIGKDNFDDLVLEKFALLDDNDILFCLKEWQHSADLVLSTLSKMIINRDLLRIQMYRNPVEPKQLDEVKQKAKQVLNCTTEEVDYFVFNGTVGNRAYSEEQPIEILMKNGQKKEFLTYNAELYHTEMSKMITKYYICYPKKIE
ncbi:MAG: HD domain-containing protein [Bacteroidota bacterium]|nr:HD domain-containing protein [Bacteroidota bacterium]